MLIIKNRRTTEAAFYQSKYDGKACSTHARSMSNSLVLVTGRLCSPVSNVSHLSKKTRASKGRIAWLPRLPFLLTFPVLDAPPRHQTGPFEQPPGGFLKYRQKGDTYIICVNMTVALNV